MGKGMGPGLWIARVYLNRMVPRFGFYVHVYECMVICGLNVLFERFSHIYVYTHTTD